MENEIALPEPNQAAVFGTQDSSGIIQKATNIANQLAPIVERAKLYSMINGRKYVKVEGWATMLNMLGIFPATEYSRRLEREGEIAYEARVILRHTSGTIVGAGEGICSSKERNWSGRDEFAIKSMAQTRATGKAARLGFSWIVAMAGFEGTPAEEMIHENQAQEADGYEEVNTGVRVPSKYWDLKKTDPAAAQELIGQGFFYKKTDHGYFIFSKEKKKAPVAGDAQE